MSRLSNTQVSRGKEGFTIIEVLIVLSVAGLLLLLVLMAIPALQRNARNNQRKQDVAAILAAISQWELNNSGGIPESGNEFLKYSKLTSYDKTSVVYDNTPTEGDADGEKNPNLDSVWVYNRRKCDINNPGQATNAGAGYNDVIALYAVETGGSSIGSQCQQL